ncbi:MAG: efflux RND transporter permease subunit, partial [bacterium]|nr:efflux RND transporter permease subunit [bacterium]
SADETVSQLRNLPVWTAEGDKIPLAAMADFRLAPGPERIERENRRTGVRVGTRYEEGTLNDYLPAVSAWTRWSSRTATPGPCRSGPNVSQQSREFLVNLSLALLLVFAVMAGLFESVRQAIGLMLALPFALAGGWSVPRRCCAATSLSVAIGTRARPTSRCSKAACRRSATSPRATISSNARSSDPWSASPEWARCASTGSTPRRSASISGSRTWSTKSRRSSTAVTSTATSPSASPSPPRPAPTLFGALLAGAVLFGFLRRHSMTIIAVACRLPLTAG